MSPKFHGNLMGELNPNSVSKGLFQLIQKEYWAPSVAKGFSPITSRTDFASQALRLRLEQAPIWGMGKNIENVNPATILGTPFYGLADAIESPGQKVGGVPGQGMSIPSAPDRKGLGHL